MTSTEPMVSGVRASGDDIAAQRSRGIALGLRANWRQFTLLVIVNAFVGAMIGLERTVLPVLATRDFAVKSTTIVLAFIATFGLTKAFANLVAGWLADQYARVTTLRVGWLIALPVPLLILAAQSWWWIVAANALLGVNQGLTWSMTVIMKIDLAGPRRRGLAMGLNEFAGYLALGVAGILSAVAADRYGLRAGAAYPGLSIAAVGLLLSFFVRETAGHAKLEAWQRGSENTSSDRPRLAPLIGRSLWRDANLFSISQAGLVNNLNDGLAWGVFPLLFIASGLSLREASVLSAIYPVSWAVFQLFTGPLSDRWGRRWLIVSGMIVQGAALVATTMVRGLGAWSLALATLGVGTALVYPTLIAAVGDVAHPSWRGAAVGVYRLWRDLGYVAGALFAGILSDTLGILVAIDVIALLTAGSGLLFALRFAEHPVTRPRAFMSRRP